MSNQTLSERFKQIAQEKERGRDSLRSKPRVEFKVSVSKRPEESRRGRKDDRRRDDRRRDDRRDDRKDDRGKNTRGRGKGKPQKKKPEKKKEKLLTAEELDAQMERYRMQDPDSAKELLDQQMDEYNKKREAEEKAAASSTTEAAEPVATAAE